MKIYHFLIFEANGVLPTHLKQYKQSSDIITYDLGIDINPIKRMWMYFYRNQDFQLRRNIMTNIQEQKLREYIRKYIKRL